MNESTRTPRRPGGLRRLWALWLMASLSLSAPAFAEDTGSAATAGQSAPATEGASSEKPLDAAQCIAFHTEGQRSSKSGDLKAALEAFTSCALEQCPDVVSAECINLRASVEKRLPTVLFSVTSAEGEDLTNYEIWMDDELLLDELDGHAVAVNPGQRTVAFVDEQGNRHEQVVVFHEGELARRVDYRLEPAVVPAPKVAPEQKRPPRRIHPLTWVGGGLALAGGGAFAGLALVGKDREKALDEECAPVCTDAEVDRKSVV